MNDDDGNNKNDETFPLQLVSSESPQLTLYPLTALLTFICPQLFGFHHRCLGHSNPVVRCTRKPVSDALQELGPYYVPRAYYMDVKSFWTLHRMLHPYLGGKI